MISGFPYHVEDKVAADRGSTSKTIVPVDAGTWSVVTQIILEGVTLAERLEVAAGLLAVPEDVERS